MLSDKLLINLKILSKLQKNGKITSSHNGIISLEKDNFLQPFRRFLTNNSRRQSIFEINSIINEAIDTFGIILNSKQMNKNFHKSDEFLKGLGELELLLDGFKNCKVGVDNLRFTYKNDHNISSQLDIIILKMDTYIKDITNKLNVLQVLVTYKNPHNININNDNINQINSPTQFYLEQDSPNLEYIPQPSNYTHQLDNDENDKYRNDIP